MVKLALVVGSCINWIIGLAAIATFCVFVHVVRRLAELDKKITDDNRRNRRAEWTEGGFKRNPDASTKEDNIGYLETFNEIQLEYSIADQIVPIFPLLGILGTVSGLIMQLENIDKMKEALAMSMSTTFYGLLAAIVLKVIDALIVSNAMNKREMYFENFEETYQMVRDKRMEQNEN